MANDLERYLKSLSDKLASELSGMIRTEAEKLSAAQRARLKELEVAPEDTGRLEDSCVVADGAHTLEVIVQAGGEATTKDGYDYAEGFEFGTSKQSARPFFFPTYREMKDDMQANINESAIEVLK